MPTFTDSRSLPSALATAVVPFLAARYGRAYTASAEDSVSIRVELTADFCADDVWQTLPPPSSAAFLGPAVRVSVAIQNALRTWLPYVWFSGGGKFDDFETAAILLMYSSCRPYTPRSKESYVFDIFDNDTPRAMLYSISRNLKPRVQGIEAALASLGCGIAFRYAERRAENMLKFLTSRRHEMNSILVAERELVEGYLDFANPRKRDRAETRIDRQLKKLFLKRDFSEIAGAIEWEAVRAAAAFSQPGRAFTAKILANSSELPPLPVHDENSACTDAVLPVAV